MDEQITKDVELATYRILAQNETRYREHLERQFTQLKWSVSVIVLAFLTVFGFLFGKTFSEVRSTVESEVKARITESAFVEELERQMADTKEDILNMAETEVRTGVKAAVASALSKEAGRRLNEAVEAKIRAFSNVDLDRALLPRGTIVAWAGEGSTPPEGWAFCNGLGETPDLRNRYLIGTSEITQVGKASGSETHSHELSVPTSVAKEYGGELGYHVTNDRRGVPPSATPYHHVHAVNGPTEPASNQPPSVYVRFIVKL